MAALFSALGDPVRLQLTVFIHRCAPSPVCACSFPEVFDLSRSTISHHLTRLVNAGILERVKKGKWAYYSIAEHFDTSLLAGIEAKFMDHHQHAEERPMKTILFACTKNAGRSQMAAAIAQQLAGTDMTILSAGTDPADDVHPEVRDALAEIGLEPHSQPEKLDPATVRSSDWVITMGCGESCPIFPGTRYENWDIPDPAGQPLDVVREIRDAIQERVQHLLTRMA